MKRILYLLILLSHPIIYDPVYAVQPYSLSFGRESLLLGSGSALTLSGSLMMRKLKPPDPDKLNREKVFFMDKIALNRSSKKNALYSDITLSICMTLPPIVSVTNDAWDTSLIMYGESIFLVSGLSLMTKVFVHRARPYAYQAGNSPWDISSPEASASFFSGHTSLAFNCAVFSALLYQKYHPDSPWIKPVWISTLTLATATGVFRITSGKHFPTDVITGAAVGYITGWFILRLHEFRDVENSVEHIAPPPAMTIFSSAGAILGLFKPGFTSGRSWSLDFQSGVALRYRF